MKEVLSLPYSDYKVLERWTQNEMDTPSKTDYYIMQMTQILHAANSKNSYKIEDFKLKFGSEKPKPMTQDQKNKAIALAQSRWKHRVGKIEVQIIEPLGTETKETL